MMQRKHSLAYVLAGIVLLNIIAIMLLHNKDVREELAIAPAEESPQPILVETAPKPIVRVLLLEDMEKCPDCFDLRAYVDELDGVIESSLEEAPATTFSVTRLPALAFSQEIEEYPDDFIAGWENVGTIQEIAEGEYAGTWYVLPTLNVPYVDMATGAVRGRVDATYLTMNSCAECYDVEVNREFMESSRIVPYTEEFVDVNSPEGQALVEQYGITNVPTLLMSAEAAEYTNMQPGWPLVGTVEEDGTYVLRNLQRLQVVYYDLMLDEVMRP